MKDTEAIVTAWYAANLADRVSRASAEAMAQVEGAVKELPPATDASVTDIRDEDTLESWFAKHFHRPPVSHDTELYNAIHVALDDLRLRLAIDSTTHD
jgi:hypothetical protein